MVDEEEHEDVVIGILDDIIDSVLDVVYDRYIQSRLVPYTVQTARDLIIQTIEWEFLACDSGEENPAVDSTWLEEEEPCAPITDSWAQGSVPVQIERPISVPVSIPELEAEISGLDSDVRLIPTRPERPTPPIDSVEPDEGSPPTPESIPSPPLQPQIDEEDNKPTDESVKPQPPETKPPQKRRGPFKPHRGKLPDYVPYDISQNTDGNDVSECSYTHLEFLSSSSMLKSPQGRPPGAKDVTYDERGNIVGVMKINPQKLPSHRVRTKFQIVDPVSEAAALAHLKAKKKGQYQLSKGPRTQQVRDGVLSGHKGGNYSTQLHQPQAHPVTPLPPPLVDIMDLSAGVVVKERGLVRKGPAQQYSHMDEQISFGSLRPLNSSHVLQTSLSSSDILTRGSPIVRPLHMTEPIPPISPASQ